MSAFNTILPASVAGRFYPADPEILRKDVETYLSQAQKPQDMAVKALIVPHAGYIYSGPIAASAYKLLEGRDISRVVLLGPSHHIAFRGVAVPKAAAMRTPLGDLSIDQDALALLTQEPDVDFLTEAFRPEHSLDVQLPFLHYLGKDCLRLIPMLVGDVSPERLDEILEKVWGGPETLILVSSDLSHFHPYDQAEQSDKSSSQAIETLNPHFLQGEQACGCRPVNGLLARARRLDMRATTLDRRNSGDTAGTKDKVVGYGAYAFEYGRDAHLPDFERQMLRDAAVTSIRHGIVHGRVPNVDLQSFPARLKALRATFVTITLAGQLRGCIGSVEPHQPLIVDVVQSAFKAAFSDPRFSPLQEKDLSEIAVKTSILGAFRPLPARSPQHILEGLEPDKDGLMILGAGKRALFLPDVWQSIPDQQQFLAALMQKAGLNPQTWPKDMQGFKFTTESF